MSEAVAEARPEEEYGHLLYARGFLLADRPEAWVPEGWARHALGGWTLWRDPRLAFAEASAPRAALRLRAEAHVASLGILLDAERPEDPTEVVLDRLAQALSRSEGTFLGALDALAGRHVILYRARGRTGLVGDAAGTRQAFHYARERRLVASHARLLVRNAAEAEPGPELPFRFGYPGLATPWRNVRLLTPNARLDLDAMTPHRFWPRRAIRPRSVESVAEEAGALMAGTVAHLAERHELRMSVTAGLDSRVALALTCDLPIRLFTFYRSDSEETDTLDRAFARAFAADTGRKVRVLYLVRPKQVPAAFRDTLAENTVGRHVTALTWALHRSFRRSGGTDLLHLRSNVSEVGREFYGKVAWPRHAGADDLARLYLRGRKGCTPDDLAATRRHFEDFARTTGILRCRRLVDLRSLFYWEHRMATWFGNVVAESDAALDTVSPYNCRRLLAGLLAVPREERASGAVHRRIIAERAPELTRYPVNGQTLWP